MNIDVSRIEQRPDAIALWRWENEGGAPGRRFESDRSWTVYHAFTGVPARADGHALTGMSRSDATKGMTSLNLVKTGRRRERTRLPDLDRDGRETTVGPS